MFYEVVHYDQLRAAGSPDDILELHYNITQETIVDHSDMKEGTLIGCDYVSRFYFLSKLKKQVSEQSLKWFLKNIPPVNNQEITSTNTQRKTPFFVGGVIYSRSEDKEKLVLEEVEPGRLGVTVLMY